MEGEQSSLAREMKWLLLGFSVSDPRVSEEMVEWMGTYSNSEAFSFLNVCGPCYKVKYGSRSHCTSRTAAQLGGIYLICVICVSHPSWHCVKGNRFQGYAGILSSLVSHQIRCLCWFWVKLMPKEPPNKQTRNPNKQKKPNNNLRKQRKRNRAAIPCGCYLDQKQKWMSLVWHKLVSELWFATEVSRAIPWVTWLSHVWGLVVFAC